MVFFYFKYYLYVYKDIKLYLLDLEFFWDIFIIYIINEVVVKIYYFFMEILWFVLK